MTRVSDTVSAEICTPSLYQTSASFVPEALQIKLKVSFVKPLNTWSMVVLASITSGSEKGKEEKKLDGKHITPFHIASHEVIQGLNTASACDTDSENLDSEKGF